MSTPERPHTERPAATDGRVDRSGRGDTGLDRGDTGLDRPDDSVVAGVVEDERLRAVVRTDGADTVVTIEGSLEDSTAAVLDELLGAVDRWQAASRRRAERARRPVQTTRLWLDASRAETLEPAVRRVLESRAARWRARHGPCVTWCAASLSRRAGTPRPSR
jgi:hypothetical protein